MLRNRWVKHGGGSWVPHPRCNACCFAQWLIVVPPVFGVCRKRVMFRPWGLPCLSGCTANGLDATGVGLDVGCLLQRLHVAESVPLARPLGLL